jgi:hypothetical protein
MVMVVVVEAIEPEAAFVATSKAVGRQWLHEKKAWVGADIIHPSGMLTLAEANVPRRSCEVFERQNFGSLIETKEYLEIINM